MEFQGNRSVCFCCLICTKGMACGHMQSMWDSSVTFSKFFDVDHPFNAEGNAFVERRNCTFRLLLSASSRFSVLSSQLIWTLVTLGLGAIPPPILFLQEKYREKINLLELVES